MIISALQTLCMWSFQGTIHSGISVRVLYEGSCSETSDALCREGAPSAGGCGRHNLVLGEHEQNTAKRNRVHMVLLDRFNEPVYFLVLL